MGKEQLAALRQEHKKSVEKQKQARLERDELRSENEESKRRQNIAKANIAHLEKTTKRLKTAFDAAEKEYRDLTIKLNKLEEQNIELIMTIDRQEKKYQHIEESLQM